MIYNSTENENDWYTRLQCSFKLNLNYCCLFVFREWITGTKHTYRKYNMWYFNNLEPSFSEYRSCDRLRSLLTRENRKRLEVVRKNLCGKQHGIYLTMLSSIRTFIPILHSFSNCTQQPSTSYISGFIQRQYYPRLHICDVFINLNPLNSTVKLNKHHAV